MNNDSRNHAANVRDIYKSNSTQRIISSQIFYFCRDLVDELPVYGSESEKGIRCNTGAVPAAVNLRKAFASSATVPHGTGRPQKVR